MIVGTKYDKELKEKVFYVREVDSYTHKTTTTLTVDWVDGVFTLTAVVSNLIGKGFVKFYRDGVEVGEQYVSKTATLLLQSETNTGVFVAKFMGNSDCLKSQSGEVSYNPLLVPDFSLTVDKDTGVVGDVLTFTPHLPDDATGSIVYTIGGVEYTKNLNPITFKFNYSGSFTVSAVYSGDESYQGATASVLVTISKTDTVLTCTVDKSSVTVGEKVLCTLYLKDNQNNPLANKTVYCRDWSKTTNDEGRVIFNYANSVSGEQTAVFKFDGDNLYNGASVTAKWTVVPAENPPVLVLESVGDLVGETGDLITFNLDSSEHLNIGETVQLINATDNSVLDSCTIKSADNTLNYTCTGKGDVSVKAKVVRGTEVTYSNILQVEDCIKYGFKASDTWSNPTGHSATNNVVDGVFTSTSNSSKGDSILSLDLSGDFIITYDAEWQLSTRCGIGAKDTTRTQHFDSGTNSGGYNQKYVSYNGSNETDTIYKNSNIEEYVNCKIIKQNNTLTGYMNNTEVVSVDYGWISQCTVWNFHTTIWGPSTIKIKNLKIKSQ